MALVTTKEIAELLSITPARVIALEQRDRSFPRRVQLSHRTLRWELDDVKSWIENMKGENNGTEIN